MEDEEEKTKVEAEMPGLSVAREGRRVKVVVAL